MPVGVGSKRSGSPLPRRRPMDIVDLPSSALDSGLDVLLGPSALGDLDDLGELATGPYTLWSRWPRCSRSC